MSTSLAADAPKMFFSTSHALRAATLLACSLFVVVGTAAATELIGAGATFPAPVVRGWAAAFEQQSGQKVVYRPVGSTEGIRRATAGSADFALTDMPLSLEELEAAGLLQFPVVLGGVVPVVNVPGIASGTMRLSGPLLADILTGRVKRWNDPAIRALNNDLDLPDLPIAAMHRSDGSGTTFLFTSYLSATSPVWRQQIGGGSSVRWPSGRSVTGSEGMASAVRGTPGALGYLEYTYALQSELALVHLRNKAGNWVGPGEPAFRAAATGSHWARASFNEILLDRDHPDAWPIVGASYALVARTAASDGHVLEFFDWVMARGGAIALENHYVPLDDADLLARIRRAWAQHRNRMDAAGPGSSGGTR